MGAVCSQKGRWTWVSFFFRSVVGGSIHPPAPSAPAPALSPRKQQRWADVGAKCLLPAARDPCCPAPSPAALLHGAIHCSPSSSNQHWELFKSRPNSKGSPRNAPARREPSGCGPPGQSSGIAVPAVAVTAFCGLQLALVEPQSNPKTVQTNPELTAFLTHVQSITGSASLQGGASHSCCAPCAPGKALH